MVKKVRNKIISGEIKTPEQTVMKNPKAGEMNKYNQQ